MPSDSEGSAAASPTEIVRLRRELEALAGDLDRDAKAVHGLFRLRLLRARDFAFRVCDATASPVPDALALDLQRLATAHGEGGAAPDEPNAQTLAAAGTSRLLSEHGRKVLIRWIDHPAVGRETALLRRSLRALVEPLGMPDQLSICLATAHFLGFTVVYPDGTEWINPFAGGPDDLLADAARIGPLFVSALSGLAHRLDKAGARLDPTDYGVLYVLAQLTLLDMKPGLSREELADAVNFWPPGWINREAATIGHVATEVSRMGRTVAFKRVLAARAENAVARLGPPAIRQQYAGGKKRRTSRATRALREALQTLVDEYQDLTARNLLALVSGADHPALGELRRALGWDAEQMPDQRRLERNWPKSRR